MATKSKSAPTVRNAFFAKTQKPTGLFVPEVPIFVQANCAQKGSWVLGEKTLGNDPIRFYVLAFQNDFEINPYKDKEEQIGTIWFTPIEDDPLKSCLVYAVKIRNQNSGRKGSLCNFAAKVAELIVGGYDPREVIWSASFVQKSGSLPDGKTYNCAVVDFGWEFPESEPEISLLENCIAVLEDDGKLLRLQAASLPSAYALPEGE